MRPMNFYASNQKKIGLTMILQSWGQIFLLPQHFLMFGTYAHWVWYRSLTYLSKFLKVIIVFLKFLKIGYNF